MSNIYFVKYKEKLQKIKIYIGTKTTFDFFRYKTFLFFNKFILTDIKLNCKKSRFLEKKRRF